MKRRSFLRFVTRGMVSAGYVAAFGVPVEGYAAHGIRQFEVEEWYTKLGSGRWGHSWWHDEKMLDYIEHDFLPIFVRGPLKPAAIQKKLLYPPQAFEERWGNAH